MDQSNMNESNTNEELSDLLTHQAGATDLHKTRKMDKPVIINPPVVSVGPYDTRSGDFDLEKN
jgi:hypothetical protein